MPTLYTMPGTCSLAANIAIAWLDAPVDVNNIAYGDHKKDAYLEINPKGKVPAVTFEDGDVLTELSAILSWLGASYGTDDYARDTVLGRKEAEALSYMTSEVHATYGGHFGPGNLVESDAAKQELKRKTYETLDSQYKHMDKILSDNGGEWYLGKRSFADTFLYVLARWIEKTLSIDDYPALKTFRRKMDGNDGVKTALKRQDMEQVG